MLPPEDFNLQNSEVLLTIHAPPPPPPPSQMSSDPLLPPPPSQMSSDPLLPPPPLGITVILYDDTITLHAVHSFLNTVYTCSDMYMYSTFMQTTCRCNLLKHHSCLGLLVKSIRAHTHTCTHTHTHMHTHTHAHTHSLTHT